MPPLSAVVQWKANQQHLSPLFPLISQFSFSTQIRAWAHPTQSPDSLLLPTEAEHDSVPGPLRQGRREAGCSARNWPMRANLWAEAFRNCSGIASAPHVADRFGGGRLRLPPPLNWTVIPEPCVVRL